MSKTIKHIRCIESAAPWLFLLPSILGTCIFYWLPLLFTIGWSFMNARRSEFVGFSNYLSVLRNPAFRLASQNTLRFLVTCLPILLASSLLVALAIQCLRPRGRVLQITFLVPIALPVASIVLVWQILFADKGLINTLLIQLGGAPIAFLDTSAAFWLLVGTYVWKNLGYDMMIWLSGLDSIPTTLYEAAAIDGAGYWRAFISITWPNLIPTLGLTALLSLVNSFRVYREAYLLAGNYPHNSIYLLQHLFNNWFLSLDIQRLTAAAILLLVAFVLGFGVYRFLFRLLFRSSNSKERRHH